MKPSSDLQRLVQGWEVRSVTTAKAAAREAGVPATTLRSRFIRAGWPAPKEWLLAIQLDRLARLVRADADRSFAACAFEVGFSSPQQAGRFLRVHTGTSPVVWRNRCSPTYTARLWAEVRNV
jgi:transcriptional regulator GlxA family with amidase domain